MTVFHNYEEFKNKISDCGIKAFEAEYAKGQAAPNIVYFRTTDNSIYANGVPVITTTHIVIELYTDRTDNDSERLFENWLCENDTGFIKTERVWLTTENWYQTVYEFDVIFDE